MSTGHPHLHVDEAALGRAAAGRESRAGVLRSRRSLVRGEPGAATDHARAHATPMMEATNSPTTAPAAALALSALAPVDFGSMVRTRKGRASESQEVHRWPR